MINSIKNNKHFRTIQLITVLICVVSIIKLQQYMPLNTVWVITSLIGGISMAVYHHYYAQFKLKKYGLWIIPVVLLLLLNSNISVHYIPLNLQAILYIVLGLNLSYRFLPQIKDNRS